MLITNYEIKDTSYYIACFERNNGFASIVSITYKGGGGGGGRGKYLDRVRNSAINKCAWLCGFD
jgi:hypothetical protein